MKIFKYVSVLSLIFVTGLSLKAQDIHFSQFYMSPLNLNPALTGVSNCTGRVIANFRNQWAPVLKSGAYNTFSMSYDQKMTAGRYDYFGIGGAFWGDVAGTHNYGTMQGKISASYSKQMGGYRKKAHFLVIGTEAGLARRGLDTDKFNFPDEDINSFETVTNPNFFFGDVSAGLLWWSILDEYTNFYVGAAFHHLNQANQSFKRSIVDSTGAVIRTISNAQGLYSKITFHGGASFEIQPRIAVLPYFVTFLQGPHVQVNVGTALRFAMGNSRLNQQGFQLGAWYRFGTQYESKLHSDAVIITTKFDYQNFGVGLSYDVNVSTLRNASKLNNALELSVIYNICGPEHRGIYCPKF
jgi:type IX secretion system PorP/SprF family membrane protein